MGPLANPANHAIVWLQLYFLLFFLKIEVCQNLLFYSKIKVLNTVNHEPAQEGGIHYNELQHEVFVSSLRRTMHKHGMGKLDMKCRPEYFFNSGCVTSRTVPSSYVILKKSCFGFTYKGYQILSICRSHPYTTRSLDSVRHVCMSSSRRQVL